VSYRLLDWALGVRDLSPAHKLLLVALAHCCNGKTGAATCWPSQTKLCALTGLSERALRYGLRELEARHLIATQTGRGRVSTRYRLACQDSPNGRLELPEPAAEPAAACDCNGARGTRRGAAAAPGAGQDAALDAPGSGATDAPQRGSSCPSEGQQMPLRGAPDAPKQGIEQGREQGDQRAPRDPDPRERERATARAALSQSPGPDWRAIAARVRPDLADPRAVRAKFEAYHRGHRFADPAAADRAWELWLLRERENCYKRFVEPPQAVSAGSFLARLAPQRDDLHADYRVMSDD